jgi:glycosyltransferase involved in cell wall biosynthesis
MYQTASRLADSCALHLIVLLDHEWEREPHDELRKRAASLEFLVRLEGKPKEFGSGQPYSVREFASPDLEWLLHREIYIRQIDVVQLEYTALGQYAQEFRQIPCILFEHDVYFQSIGRALPGMRGAVRKIKATFEYLRALRYELRILPRFDRVQVCSAENRDYLLSFRPELAGKIEADLRAGIDTSRYTFRADGREPLTMLFLGSFRHTPNMEALDWFVRLALPHVLEQRPEARLVVIGSDPPPRHSLSNASDSIELKGFVADIHEPLARYSVFVCPILSGSGMRVKLLEAFAAGIPVVSTRVGAEGLAETDGEICALADDPLDFARRILELFGNPQQAQELARRARETVVATKDMGVMTGKLVESYRQAVREKRTAG